AGYQITQLFSPICTDGAVEIETPAGRKTITLKQIHIEEDAGKLLHDARTGTSLVDYNRAGVPLVEIVSNPDFRSAQEVVAYLVKIQKLLTFAGVSDCKMQEGSMRCDVNLSVREAGTETLGTRTEMKNMNSLRAIVRAIEYETQRHIDALELKTETLVQETRRWDDNAGESYAMRDKEDALDYRYFPNADIMPIRISEDWIERVRASLPESAGDKYARLTQELSISAKDAAIITGSKNLADIFDALTGRGVPARDATAWIVTELLALGTDERGNPSKPALMGSGKGSDDIAIDSERFADLILMVNRKEINRAVAKKVLGQLYTENIDPAAYVKEHNLGLVSDTSFLEEIVSAVLTENADAVEKFRSGNDKVLGFLMGQIMARAAGKADPNTVREMLKKQL
ncbi:MAG: Asp-tRNA(Asn)/Glu-tRNA(Gln) amidotransferase subunit GatB, partial [Clostridiales bacterium]|nr:Asp-tRNA(Asn)/Glu-tRNA(Gln) amidotransferase subunit GatB [Clostridiales bacterium]